MALTNLSMKAIAQSSHEAVAIPVVPPTAPSVSGSDVFYIIIAIAVFTKVTLEAIALIIRVVLRNQSPAEK